MNLALIKTFLIFLTLSFSFTIDQSEIHSLTIKFRQQVNEGNMQMAEQTAESLLLHLEIDTNLVPQNFANKLNELATFYIEIDNLNKAKELFYRSLFIYEYELKNIQSKLIMPLSNLKYLHKIKEEKVQVFDIQNQLDQINKNIENWEMDSLQLFANQYTWFPEIRYFDLGLPEINQPNLINEEGIELANIGLKYLTEGFYSEALELLSQAVEIDPININYEFITQKIFSNKDSANVFLNYINNNIVYNYFFLWKKR